MRSRALDTYGLIDVARIHGVRDVRLHREPSEPPADGEELLRVRSVGICGSDLHWFDEAGIGDARLDRPLVLGHEFAGEIASGARAGERVVGEPADPCGDCPECRRDASNLCTRMRFAGHGRTDGALRTFMPWPARLLRPIPDDIGDDSAPLLEPAAIAVHALALASSAMGGSVGVFGCGPIGLLIVQLLRDAGVGTIVATDTLPHRVQAATAMGATQAVAVSDEDGRAPLDLPPLDVAFEVGGTDAALHDALGAVRPGSVVVLVGIPAGDRTSFAAALARRKGLTLVMCRRSRPADLTEAIALAAEGRLDLDPLVTDRFPMAEAPAAFARAATRRGLKVMILP
jgi:L-iditol 2-dehydrogenase